MIRFRNKMHRVIPMWMVGLMICASFAWAPGVLAQNTPMTGTTTAVQDLSCGGNRGATGCTAGEFVLAPPFYAVDTSGNPVASSCTPGDDLTVNLQISLDGANTTRYRTALFFGQDMLDPKTVTAAADTNDPTTLCSVATFPIANMTSPPWVDPDANTNFDGCSDFVNQATAQFVQINNIHVKCMDDGSGNLQVPYQITYQQNESSTMNCGPATVQPGTSSKCNSGFATVSGITINTTPVKLQSFDVQ